jgi:hypothetical protein
MNTKMQPSTTSDTSHISFTQLSAMLHITAGMGSRRVRLHSQLVMAPLALQRGVRFIVDQAALPFADREER